MHNTGPSCTIYPQYTTVSTVCDESNDSSDLDFGDDGILPERNDAIDGVFETLRFGDFGLFNVLNKTKAETISLAKKYRSINPTNSTTASIP